MIRSSDEVGDSAHAGSPMHRASTSLAAMNLTLGDLDVLFDAVEARLELTVSDEFRDRCAAQGEDPAGRVREAVLECVTELGQLQAMMAYEIGRRRLFEQTIADLHGVLAELRTELAGTRASEREARHRALHDGLTLLPNGNFFRSKLNQALSKVATEPQPIAVLYLDLDGFKAINDTHGHDAGDSLLRIVAVRLSGAVRAHDLVGRVGGDEFVCLIVGVPDREHLEHRVRKLFDAVASPLTIGRVDLVVRPSIGVAMCPDDGITTASLLRNADAAMYRAKRERCGHAFFDARVDAWADDDERGDGSSIFDATNFAEIGYRFAEKSPGISDSDAAALADEEVVTRPARQSDASKGIR